MNKKVALDKKSTGPGVNVSAACSEVKGEGFKPGAAVIRQVNESRRGNFYRTLPDTKARMLPEDDNPFIRLMMIGANKDGSFSEGFSLWLKYGKKVAKSLS